MKKRFILLFIFALIFISFISLASANIVFNNDFATYNIGDVVNVDGYVESTTDVRDVFRLYLECGNSIQVFARTIDLDANKRYFFSQDVTLPFGSKGQCNFKATFNGETQLSEKFEISEEIRRPFVELAEFSSRARSVVERNMFSREKEIIMVHFPEMPGRFATQLSVLASGYMVLNGGELKDEDKKMLYKISLDSIPHVRRLCLQALTQFSEVETNGLAVYLKLPPSTLRLNLSDLAALKVIDYTKAGNRDQWRLHDNYRELMVKYEGIAMGEGTLEADEQPDDEPPFGLEPVSGDLVKTAMEAFPNSEVL